MADDRTIYPTGVILGEIEIEEIEEVTAPAILLVG
jgi:hypothetical protein